MQTNLRIMYSCKCWIHLTLFMLFFQAGLNGSGQNHKLPAQLPITGQWVNNKYINALHKSKSARYAQNCGEVIMVNVDAKRNVFINFNFHEGADCKIYKRENNTFFLDWENIILKQLDAKTMLYINADNVDTLLYNDFLIGYDSNYLLNKIVFSGLYHDLETGRKIIFTDDGKVSGLKNFKSYIACNDYYDAAMDFDLMKFNLEDHNDKGPWVLGQDSILTWKISADTLKIYRLKCKQYQENSTDCVELDLGKLVYRLKKIK